MSKHFLCFNLKYLAICFEFLFYIECPKNLVIKNNELHYLSTEPLTYDEAENICLSVGGDVARISEDDTEYIWPYFNQTFLKGNSIVFWFSSLS